MDKENKTFIERLTSSFIRRAKITLSLSRDTDINSATQNIKNNIDFKGANVYILASAIVIASIGLNVNSIPIIIGAMLISPLMGPIIGIGYSLGVNDTELLKKSAFNLMVMVLISISASFLYFLLSPLQTENPTELLARTNPTIFDVLVAIFGGFVGILEITKRTKGTVLAGVAIATAIMPPLCTAGYGIATGSLIYFFGAIYLFFINSVFISLATFIFVRFQKFPRTTFADPVKERKMKRIIGFISLILIIPSIYSAVIVVQENSFNQSAKTFVEKNKNLSKSYIYDYHISHKYNNSNLEISIAGEALTEMEVESLYRSFEDLGISRKHLTIVQNAANTTADVTNRAVVQSIFERNDIEIKQREKLLQEKDAELKEYKMKEIQYKQITKELLAHHPNIVSLSISRGADINIKDSNTTELIIFIIQCDIPVEEKELKRIKEWLKVRLDFDNIKIIQNHANAE